MTAPCRVSDDERNHDMQGQVIDRQFAKAMINARADMKTPDSAELGPFCKIPRPLKTYLIEAIKFEDHSEIWRVIERAPDQMRTQFAALIEIFEREAYVKAINDGDEDEAGKIAFHALVRLRAKDYMENEQ